MFLFIHVKKLVLVAISFWLIIIDGIKVEIAYLLLKYILYI